jgi:hypothetical protein
MTTRSAKLRRLHFLNALFAPLTGHDLYLAEQIDGAIASSFDEVKERTPADPDFVRAAAHLFEKLCREQTSHGFFHWDATSDDAGGTPLFARAGLMQGLKRLAPCREITVLITNLRAAQCPQDVRWTAKRQREYDDVLSLLRQLTAARTRRGANVNLLFL